MRFRLFPGSCLAALVFVLSAGPIGVRTQAPAPLNLRDRLPFDTAIHTATLPNGLKYFVRRNDVPAKRVALRLAVKSGSLEEADDQQGLAHFIEHMAFNGSAHFKPGELVSTFESVGARLGPHVNAYTSFDETVYMLDLPSDQPQIVAKGLAALADFAGGLTLDPAEVDKERGVVIEEWRGGLGASSRVRDKQLPLLLAGSRYADRLPIGKPDVIRTAPAARLRAFYDTWYRPERMAVIAVGDIAAPQLEAAIASLFGPLKPRAPAAPMPNAAVPLPNKLLVSFVADREMTRSVVEVVRKRPAESEQRVADYRRDLVKQLTEHMFNERFAELARKPEAPFLGAGVSDGQLGRTVDTFSISAGVQDGHLDQGIAAIAVEAQRVKEHGFTAAEIDRAKKWMAALFDRVYAERNRTDSGTLAQECLKFFLVAEPTPGIAYEHQLVQQVLPGITLAETWEAAKRLLADNSRVVLAVAPQKAGLQAPTDAELLAALAKGEHAPVAAWTTTATGSAGLMDHKPEPGRVASRRTIDALGVTVVRFANGVEAWLKPTDFKNDQVLFSMESLGGSSLAPAADFPEASLSAGYVSASGAGPLKALDLQRVLAGKLASASPSMGLSTHGFSGSAAPAELETALQLLYDRFTAPGDDPEAFALIKRQLTASSVNREQSPGRVFNDRVAEVNTSNHYTAEPVTPDRVAALDREKMLAYYRARFSNAADFSFVMVGAFKLDEAIPLLAQYVGSLPSTGTATAQFKDVGIAFPRTVQRATVEKGQEPRGQTVISFFAEVGRDPVEQEKLGGALIVLDIALRDILRESLGQTYTVSVSRSEPFPQRGDGHVMVTFGAAPENLASMTDRVFQEVARLRTEGPSADLTTRAKETSRRGYETALKQNGYWLQHLVSAKLFGEDPGEILTRNARIDTETPDTLREMFQRYFPQDRYTVVTLVPERK
ncbi:MAG TPA: insulinase family protein [Vicinamibacterales bacterium]|nr:insulinase family protein [Vicinamibacterales bacterium]